MEALYSPLAKNTMVFSKKKSDLEIKRREDEVIIPIGDTEHRIGWALISATEYIKARYGTLLRTKYTCL